eukprot:TRINITY_DN14506_c0_g1_i1.p1 TRINITY_DN14506_c0_g1~~TRINITY_DN14506_c0_g1_i1.p1  ORF type:complete len:275 (-),score=30.11 TRINITY_DN14506_c0_g1_i1:67-891(-)
MTTEDPGTTGRSKWSSFMPGKPMRSCDCRDIKSPVSRVFDAIVDCTQYQKWWPSYKFDVKNCGPGPGSTVHFETPNGGYDTVVHSEVKDESMTVDYGNGIVRGRTVWSVAPLDQDTSRICYDANLEPVGKRVRLLSNFMGADHIKSNFTCMLDNLEQYLEYGSVVGHVHTTGEHHADHHRHQHHHHPATPPSPSMVASVAPIHVAPGPAAALLAGDSAALSSAHEATAVPARTVAELLPAAPPAAAVAAAFADADMAFAENPCAISVPAEHAVT